jgi:hypothetical protein
MAVTHPTAMRNTIADLVVDSLDVGGPGLLVFRLTGTAGSPGTAVATMTGGLTVGAGDTVSCSSLTYSAPA